VQQFLSVQKELWRDNCGGMVRKARGYDAAALRAWLAGSAVPAGPHGEWDFDAIVFFEDFARNGAAPAV